MESRTSFFKTLAMIGLIGFSLVVYADNLEESLVITRRAVKYLAYFFAICSLGIAARYAHCGLSPNTRHDRSFYLKCAAFMAAITPVVLALGGISLKLMSRLPGQSVKMLAWW